MKEKLTKYGKDDNHQMGSIQLGFLWCSEMWVSSLKILLLLYHPYISRSCLIPLRVTGLLEKTQLLLRKSGVNPEQITRDFTFEKAYRYLFPCKITTF